MGASSQTTIAKITVLMDMEAMFVSRSESSESACNLCSREGIRLLEFDNTSANLIWLRVHDADGSQWINRAFLGVTELLSAHTFNH